jgi:hypothetical protein
MNTTEKKALKWFASQNITVNFASRRSPDFISNVGHGYEVKLLRQNAIAFSRHQFELLKQHPHVTILVFNHGEAPIYTIPFIEIRHEPPYWRDLHITVFSALDYKPKTQQEADVQRQAHAKAILKGITMRQAVFEALEYWIKEQDESQKDTHQPA